MRHHQPAGDHRCYRPHTQLHNRQPEQNTGDRLVGCQLFGGHQRTGKTYRTGNRRHYCRIELGQVRPGDNQNPNKPQRNGQQPTSGKRLTEKDRRQHGNPDRRGKFQRKQLRKGNIGNRQKPQILPGKMRGVAKQM